MSLTGKTGMLAICQRRLHKMYVYLMHPTTMTLQRTLLKTTFAKTSLVRYYTTKTSLTSDISFGFESKTSFTKWYLTKCHNGKGTFGTLPFDLESSDYKNMQGDKKSLDISLTFVRKTCKLSFLLKFSRGMLTKW